MKHRFAAIAALLAVSSLQLGTSRVKMLGEAKGYYDSFKNSISLADEFFSQGDDANGLNYVEMATRNHLRLETMLRQADLSIMNDSAFTAIGVEAEEAKILMYDFEVLKEAVQMRQPKTKAEDRAYTKEIL